MAVPTECRVNPAVERNVVVLNNGLATVAG